MKKALLLIIILVLITSLTSCFPGDKSIDDEPAGFLWGILHGWLAPLSLFLSIFKDNIRIYEVVNTGFWYDFGFYIAVISGFGGISLSRKKKDK
ncbi:hypothetical protein EZV73_18780 [Acidaminobacter sp. JC074]|uniref:hypothetical protein n=1 Tax=Acidaminobacter sp. JC074 TaxID=2530199 RepID=UPI001F10ABD6|nr:hypothetical protein [Acidaminobacter sp. JC074]MCH4889635.1 hypothetical protein [Acidaminobacter sp. JC074]